MLVAILLLGTVLLAAGSAALGWMFVSRRRTRGSAHVEKTHHLNARWWRTEGDKTGDLLYVALGDSTAQGIGASAPGRSYVGLIARHLRTHTQRSVRVINLSVYGARLGDALEVQLPKLRTLSPDLLTVALGANDIANFNADRFERELDTLFAALPARTLVADLPSFYLGSSERNVRVAITIVQSLAARYGFEVAQLYDRTRRQGAARYALNQVSPDFFHPNDRGYRVWASAFLPLVNRVIAEHQVNTPQRRHPA